MKIGDWVMWCCEEDLHRIEDQDEIDEIEASIADSLEMDEHPMYQIFPTKDAALESLL